MSAAPAITPPPSAAAPAHLSGIASLSPQDRPAAALAAALLLALLREEAAGRRSPPILLEAGRPTWARFRGRLTSRDLLALLFEDAAVLHPIPFALKPLEAPLARVPIELIDSWLAALPQPPADPADYLAALARLLGVPSRLARADLHVVKPHHRVL